MTKILHIISDSNIGGAGLQMLALLDAQTGINRSEFAPTVVLPQGAKLVPRLKEQGVDCIELSNLAEKSFGLGVFLSLRAVVKKLRPHIVHTHASLSGRLAARLCSNAKIVHTRHSVFEPTQKMLPLRLLRSAVNNFSSHAVIAVSPAAMDNLLALGIPETKIHVIYNGTQQVKEFPPSERAILRDKHDIPPHAFAIVQVARLTEVKGQDDVLTAAKELKDAGVVFLLCGTGPTKEHLQHRITSENITNVKLMGFVTDMAEIYAVADAQISASYGTEATSLALVEGKSVGLPTIATNYGGNPYVIAHNKTGLIIPIKSPAAIAEAAKKLQATPDIYAAFSQKAREIYATKFTAADMVKNTENLYRNMQKPDDGNKVAL